MVAHGYIGGMYELAAPGWRPKAMRDCMTTDVCISVCEEKVKKARENDLS